MIDAKDIKVHNYPQGSQGGMNVGLPAGVEVIHIPSGLVARCTTERSQHRNKQKAIEELNLKWDKWCER